MTDTTEIELLSILKTIHTRICVLEQEILLKEDIVEIPSQIFYLEPENLDTQKVVCDSSVPIVDSYTHDFPCVYDQTF